jgi:hypothetical protein
MDLALLSWVRFILFWSLLNTYAVFSSVRCLGLHHLFSAAVQVESPLINYLWFNLSLITDSFSSASVGLTYVGPLISAFIATLLAGPLTGYCARVLSKRNKGIFEPEFKLLPVVLYLIFGTMGFVGFGMSLQRGMMTPDNSSTKTN